MSGPTIAKFWGSNEEDAADWLCRYEEFGHFNRWTDGQLRQNFGIYLEGIARMWFAQLVKPETWGDVDVGATNVPGLRSLFREAFLNDDHLAQKEEQLLSRRQGPGEPVEFYYYQVLDLRRQVDQTMSVERKLKLLMRGLRPELMERMFPLQPTSLEDFLVQAKLFSRALGMSKVALSQPTVPPRQEPPRARAVVGETTSQGGTDEVLRLLKELVLQGNNGPHPPPNRTMPVPRPERTHTGRAVCFRCNEVGHIARCCRNDQPVRAADIAAPRGTSRVSHVLPSAEVLWGQGRTAYHGDRQINTVAATASLPVGQVEPVLTIDPTNLVRDAVNCNGVLVSAVIDTGAAVTIVSPALVKSLNLRDEGWTGQLITVATGQRVVPLGSVTVTVSNKNGVASGTALIMEMSGINLLLGNDFLRQFRSLTIEYGGDRPELTLGVEESLSNPVPAEVPVEAKSLQSLPAHTLTAVTIDRPTLANYGGPYLLEPSVNLLQAKSLTTGRTLLPDQPTPGFVMMLNLAHSDTTIMPDTTLDTVFPVSEPMTMQDTEAEPVNGIDLTDTFAEDLQPTDREELIKCFRKHSTCFASDDSDTGLCVRVEHDILTGDAAPTTTLPDAPAQGPCVSTSTLPFSPTGSSQSSDGSVD